ncbi:hypothetical protein B7C51_03060 [Paenibacillus larvae subsp. pulvifaciens]|uniref:Uncharacterized protein n=1 Tax=Paenibacillus larvae subsp. pulvifaciens TaxID=1477 RepID=A0A1V0UPE3_9BACL|nr:hypothetical protein [Paenibacillus larvae]ARF67001.1 hypothetical protein B7C51_03060 [Paenibacillus larvae subsp. pulvifaciens]
MLMEWLDPALEKRTWEIVEICERENIDLYKKFDYHLGKLKRSVQFDSIDDLQILEDLFIQKNLVVKLAYRIGFDDALKIKRELL